MHRNPDIDPRLLAANGARYFSPEALAEADREGAAYKSRTALVLMHPQDFLDMAQPGKREEAQAALERVIGAGIGFRDVPRLFVSADGDDPRIAHVTGHEGRHRSRALLARGVTQMPVRIHSQTIRWSEQSDPKSWDYEDQLPERLYGEGENRRNVLPMPVPLHYPELAPRMRAAARVNPRRRTRPSARLNASARGVISYRPDPTASAQGEWDRTGAVPVWRQAHDALVLAALDSWKGAPSEMKLHIADERANAPLPASGSGKQKRAQAAALLYEMAHNNTVSRKPLFRGSHETPRGEQSWTTSRKIAERWAAKNNGQVFELPAGTRGLRIEDYFYDTTNEKEWLISTPRNLDYAMPLHGRTVRTNLRRRNPEDDYRMRHRPNNDGPRAHELGAGEIPSVEWSMPEDVMMHPEWYTGFRQYLPGFWPALRAAQRRPKAVLRIYRALPKPHATFREGDWVTLSWEYAEAHLESNLGDAGHIIEAEVPADTLRFAGDDLMEWGYWGPSIKGTPVRRPARLRPARLRNPAPTSDASARADAFREWFRNSKIVDENGEPLVVYHGGFDVLNSRNGTFRKSKTGSLGSGIYFTPDRSAAEYYMAHRGGYEAVENGVITEAYLSVQNPLVVRPTHDEDPTVEALVLLGESRDRAYDKVEKIRERFGDMGATLPNAARAAGYDGIVRIGWRDGKVAEIVVFEPWQVKSATRNAGTYYPYGSDIRTNPDRWQRGKCLVFAEALKRAAGRKGVLYDVVEDRRLRGRIVETVPHHVVLRVGTTYWDSEGPSTEAELLARWEARAPASVDRPLRLEKHDRKRARDFRYPSTTTCSVDDRAAALLHAERMLSGR